MPVDEPRVNNNPSCRRLQFRAVIQVQVFPEVDAQFLDLRVGRRIGVSQPIAFHGRPDRIRALPCCGRGQSRNALTLPPASVAASLSLRRWRCRWSAPYPDRSARRYGRQPVVKRWRGRAHGLAPRWTRRATASPVRPRGARAGSGLECVERCGARIATRSNQAEGFKYGRACPLPCLLRLPAPPGTIRSRPSPGARRPSIRHARAGTRSVYRRPAPVAGCAA